MHFYNIYIYVRLRSTQSLIDVQYLNPRPISMSQTSVPQIYVLFSNSQIGIHFSNLWPVLTFSNRRLDLRIHILSNRTVIWDNDVSGCQFDEWTLIWARMLKSCPDVSINVWCNNIIQHFVIPDITHQWFHWYMYCYCI